MEEDEEEDEDEDEEQEEEGEGGGFLNMVIICSFIYWMRNRNKFLKGAPFFLKKRKNKKTKKQKQIESP